MRKLDSSDMYSLKYNGIFVDCKKSCHESKFFWRKNEKNTEKKQRNLHLTGTKNIHDFKAKQANCVLPFKELDLRLRLPIRTTSTSRSL